MAAHHPEAAAWSSRVRNLQVRDACARHCAASHASRTPPTHPPPRRQAAPGPAPPHAEAGPENRAGTITSSPPRYAGITWFPAFGITPPVDLQAPQAWKRFRKPGNVSSNLGAAGVLRTCFSLSSPPSWFQRQAAAAELSSASMEAARRSECRGNRLSRRQFFVWCWFCSLVCLIFLLPKSNKGGDRKVLVPQES